MIASPVTKTVVLFCAILGVVTSTFILAVFHAEDAENRVAFTLTGSTGERLSHKDLQGKHLLVVFGFTHCSGVCPTQMSKLTHVMNALYESGQGNRVRPVFISIDPERDSVAQVADYIGAFHPDFIGLTGTRSELEQTTHSFKTLLAATPIEPSTEDYQLTHSTMLYVVDEFSRVVEFIPLSESTANVTEMLRRIL